ncbi:MAG: gliding motility-associated C-terminal domain-containing protein [Bacteroidota bacterium]
MNNLKASILFILTGFYSFGQFSVCLGTDITVCPGQSVTINNCNPSQVGSGTVLNNPTAVSLSDDMWSGVIPIGFGFNFYGTNYTNCVIGSNGLISFNTANANTGCAWSLGGMGTLPQTGLNAARNAASICYQDINPGVGGQIVYKTIGTAPNREFYVLYANVPMFSSGECTYMCAIFFETSNTIEYHIGNKPISTWNGGLAIQATENAAGTVAHVTPGRNNTQWTAFQDGRMYTPTAPNNTSAYTIAQIPYKAIISGNANYVWQSTTGQTFPYNNGALNLTNVQAGTTGYFLTVTGSGCSAGLGAVSDTTWVTAANVSASTSHTPDICSSGQGTVTVTPTSGIAPYTFNWPALGSQAQTVTGVTSGPYVVQMTDANGCVGTATVIVSNTPATYSSSTTVVSCPGGADGTATATMTPQLGTVSYLWNDPAAQTTQTATGLSAGTYSCAISSSVGCNSTVNVTITEIPGMVATLVSTSDVTCNSGNDGMIEISVAQGTAPYTYSWDNSTSTLASANDLMVGSHTVTIMDANSCVITHSEILAEPAPLSIVTLTPDTQICSEATATLDVTGAGGSSPYIYTWFENGVQVGTGAQITVDPLNTNTTYCVTLSEQCGSPTKDSCMLVYFPTPIVPTLTPDKTESCMPGDFVFSNTSANGAEIATMSILFSEGTGALLNGLESFSTTFEDPNTYSVDMTVTSIYGCIYTNSHTNLVEVLQNPTANFTFSANPTTFFETAISVHDMSSYDVAQWDWYSPGSNPSDATGEHANFMFPDGEVGQYPITLTVTTALGCTDTITKFLNVVPAILFYAPNTFTPDDDEYNQNWEYFVSGIDIYDFVLTIYNRWGELIWETHDPSASWDGTYDGKIVQSGGYVWKAIVKDPLTDDKKEFGGAINVLR